MGIHAVTHAQIIKASQQSQIKREYVSVRIQEGKEGKASTMQLAPWRHRS